jgi:uroporphyrinogen III methyltransferase/synthase
MRDCNTTFGMVYLVGAGPGDPGLITLRGVECLGRAQLVLYDESVDPAILAHVSPSAELVCLGQPGPQCRMPQEGIHARMIEAVRAGKIVVRLQAGDPTVSGRETEQASVLRAAGVPFQTVPGVSAALAAAGYAEIPMTHAQHGSAAALVVSPEGCGQAGPEVDYEALADFPGTLVFSMGVTHADRWSGALLRRGKPSETPVAIVHWRGWNDHEAVRCTLGTVAQVIAQRSLGPPAVVFVGGGVSCAPEVSWFAARPLFGQRVLVTRPRHQAGPLLDRLAELGAQILVQPAIRISEPTDWGPVDAELARLDRYDWLVFSSVNGVRSLLDRLFERGGDLRRLANVRLAAIGPATAEELAKYRLRADLVPEEYRAEALAAVLAAEASGRTFVLARASRGRQVLAERLTAAGGAVRQIVVYRSTDVEEPDPEVAAAMAAGRIDWVTVTSSAIARSLVRLFGDDLRRGKLASISPVTSGVLRQLGYRPAVEATRYTMEGLVEVMVRFGEGGESESTGGRSESE